ncbi:MAG TPA: AI-2E family transporter [Limnobacter sp.]|nr:AI-2E family transporter [Limnobacter sp.]
MPKPLNDKPGKPVRIALADVASAFYLRNWALLLSAGLVLLFTIQLWGVLAPFVAAFALAYLMHGPSRWLHRQLRGRVPLPVCAVVTFFGLMLLFSSFGLLFIPVVLTQLDLIQNNLPQLLVNIKRTVLPWLNDMFGLAVSVDSIEMRDRIAQYISENRGTLAEVSTKVLRSGSQSVLGLTGFVSLTVVATLFILPGWAQIAQAVQRLFPLHVWRRTQPMLIEIDTVLNEYIKGMMIVVLFLSTFYSVGLSIAGLQSGWAIGMLAGLLSVVPYLGFALALLVALLTAALELQGFLPLFWVLVVFVLGQMIEGFVLTPLVVGDKIGLSAIAVIFALAFFGALFGLVGVFLALPLAAIFKVAYMHAFEWYVQSDYYRQAE